MFPIQIHLILLHTFLLETIFFMSKYTQQSPDGSQQGYNLGSELQTFVHGYC